MKNLTLKIKSSHKNLRTMKGLILFTYLIIIGISNNIHAQTGTFSVIDYGATGDGETLDTKAI
jgi:hypothetical protein